jgi:hypothetical protein
MRRENHSNQELQQRRADECVDFRDILQQIDERIMDAYCRKRRIVYEHFYIAL